MTVIAMTREMGTLGKDVAAGVSEKLGIEVIHHELVERQLAERLNTSASSRCDPGAQGRKTSDEGGRLRSPCPR